MSEYSWTITKDYLAEPDSKPGTNSNAVGVVGPFNCKLTAEDILKDPNRKEFQIRDSDDEPYYEGFIVGEFDGFEPLDDFGKPNAGASIILYKENGVFKPC